VSFVEHPKKIGQVKATNMIISRELKKKLKKPKGLWTEENT